MRPKYNVVTRAIYFSPVLELHKYIKYLNREKNIFLAYNNKLSRSHRYHDARSNECSFFGGIFSLCFCVFLKDRNLLVQFFKNVENVLLKC